jgi:hypothetical protein
MRGSGGFDSAINLRGIHLASPLFPVLVRAIAAI